MIINTQAFATSLKEGGRSKESRIIYSKRDEFETSCEKVFSRYASEIRSCASNYGKPENFNS